MPNRLANETSPYLQQHAHNPVDWYPWGLEALGKARTENKPILLSIGYSACHWCHVMEKESFENPEIAALMNAHFVNIKVDREERPDLDQVYQNVAQLLTHGGGWPLTVFLTPDLKPFFGGTYFPPEDRYGRPGFPRVLQALSNAYANDKASVSENARKLTLAIEQLESGQKTPAVNSPATEASLRKVIDSLLKSFDWENGGFGGAPKFPNTMNLSLLWRYGTYFNFPKAFDAVLKATVSMAQAGIYDHLGGGFHRYSVDEKWAVPHFEKMLYDNALLLKLYSEILLTKNSKLSPETRALFVKTLRETVEYILREMKNPDGGFFSTQDADSEGKEGKFFVWTQKEIEEVLGNSKQGVAETRAFLTAYGVQPDGNFEETNSTVLALHEFSSNEEGLLNSARIKLFEARQKRIAPMRDEKILTSWNGLMISGLAWAAQALKSSGYTELSDNAFHAATQAFHYIRKHGCQNNSDRLFSVIKDGKGKLNGYLDDYAFMAMAALDLARFSHTAAEVEALTGEACRWVDIIRKHFFDHDQKGYFFTSDDHELLLARPKTLHDQAIPSGTAITLEVLWTLAEIMGEPTYEVEATEAMEALWSQAMQSPFSAGELACAATLSLVGPIAVSGHHVSSLCENPFVFQKANSEVQPEQTSILICHRKTCISARDVATTEGLIRDRVKG